jgi:long-chain fatty acid transport protein
MVQAKAVSSRCGGWSRIMSRMGLLAAMGTLVVVGPDAGPALGQGVALRGVSAINESFGGVATAAPLDAAGAIHWNPATISGLPGSEMTFGLGLIIPSEEISSRLPAGSVHPANPTIPPVTLSGSTRGEPGAIPTPTMAFVHQVEDSPWSYGMGMFGIGGSRVNYPASTSNPILTPQAPAGFGLGRLSAEVEVLQIVPVASYEVTDQLSIGFGPTITMAKLVAMPLFLGPADNSVLPAYPTYSSGVGTRYIWGGGFEVGLYYVTRNDWHLGVSCTSPQWMESFRFNSEGQDGSPRQVEYHLDYPLVASLGVAYSGFEKWVIGCDLRYFDYANTAGFRDHGFAPDGTLTGLDWNSVMSVGVGVQRQLGERLIARMGYTFCENPIDSAAACYNVASPLIIQHTLHLGGSYLFADNWAVSVAYVHCFENSVEGEMHPASGAIAGSSVESTVSADELSLQITKRF